MKLLCVKQTFVLQIKFHTWRIHQLLAFFENWHSCDKIGKRSFPWSFKHYPSCQCMCACQLPLIICNARDVLAEHYSHQPKLFLISLFKVTQLESKSCISFQAKFLRKMSLASLQVSLITIILFKTFLPKGFIWFGPFFPSAPQCFPDVAHGVFCVVQLPCPFFMLLDIFL